MPEVGGTCLQAESEIAAINMVYGAGAGGIASMTPTSGLGLSLMQEALSQMCAVEVPAVVVDMARMGPGLGTLSPSQSDYFLATRGTGHGDSRAIVLAPATVQEAADLTVLAFDLAHEYRNPVLVMGDALLAQVLEPVRLPDPRPAATPCAWGAPGWTAGTPNLLGEYKQDLASVEESVRKLQRKYARIEAHEPRWDAAELDDAELVVVAYGTAARIASDVIGSLRGRGVRVGLFRPITLWPFPAAALARACQPARQVVVAEMNLGQMVDDVRLALEGRNVISNFLSPAGAFAPEDLAAELAAAIKEVAS
jgi:2-oxoglutarate ferredoxin oxidoreductase subunit alpha